MKKALALFVSLSILVSIPLNAFSKESDIYINGLDECLNKIRLNSDINTDIREKILEANEAYLQNRINEIMEYPDYVKEKMGLKLGTDEYIKKQIRDGYELNMDKGLLISSINTTKYLNQYSNEKCLSYLFNNDVIFKVCRNKKTYGIAAFSDRGQALMNNEISNNYIDIDDENIFNYINDSSQIKSAIEQKGETAVGDIKIFGLGFLTVLYIKCESNEYLVKLYDRDNKILPKMNLYELYKAEEFIGSFDEEEAKSSIYSHDLAESVLLTKPIYQTEAESLQSDGLLKGNDKGLDLLKPMTRIEATAMLVRAMGYEDSQTSDTSYFADIQSDNWGAKYANIAKDKGITTGVGNDMFAPNDTITASQFATLILRNMGENPDWQTAIDTFVERGLITSEQAGKMDLFTRGDMAKIIYEARQKNMF